MTRTRTKTTPQDHDHDDEDTLYELSTLILNIINPSRISGHRTRPEKITPAGFAAMLMGVSVAMMFCGSVTFFIGFLLMPWVLGFVVVLYVVGVVSSASMVWRSVFGGGFLVSSVDSIRKEASARKLL